jgi:hypothetical protein
MRSIERQFETTVLNRRGILIDKNQNLKFSDSAISPVLILQTKLPFLDTPAPTPENNETQIIQAKSGPAESFVPKHYPCKQ